MLQDELYLLSRHSVNAKKFRAHLLIKELTMVELKAKTAVYPAAQILPHLGLLYQSCFKIEFQTRRRPEFKPDPVGAKAVQLE